MPNPKPCDNPKLKLPCLYMGKCRGRVGIHGPVRQLRKRSQIDVCPCEAEVMEWVENTQTAQRNTQRS
jgi:hypothetical protein